MSLMVKVSKEPYDDSEDRQLIKNYLTSKDFDIKENAPKDGIDLSGCRNGKIYAIEIGSAVDWPIGAKDYALLYIEIPARKWAHFATAFYHPERVPYDVGVYWFLSHDKTHAMFFDFKDLLNIDIEDFDNTITRIKHSSNCVMVKVPVSLVKKTVKIC